MGNIYNVVEVSDIQQALAITQLRNGNGRGYHFFRVIKDNRPILRAFEKAEALKNGLQYNEPKTALQQLLEDIRDSAPRVMMCYSRF